MGTPRVTRKLRSTCSDGDCPAIWETTDPAIIGVQGEDPSEPGRERIVFVPREFWETAGEAG